jgi:hypothetical protein
MDVIATTDCIARMDVLASTDIIARMDVLAKRPFLRCDLG